MRPLTPEARQLAERIVAREGVAIGQGEDLSRALDWLIARLGASVARQLGAHGAELLVGRSLELAKAQHPWLGRYERPGGSEAGRTAGALPERDPAEAHAVLVEVVARFVWLLETFLGEDLTRQMLSESWADAQSEEGLR